MLRTVAPTKPTNMQQARIQIQLASLIAAARRIDNDAYLHVVAMHSRTQPAP